MKIKIGLSTGINVGKLGVSRSGAAAGDTTPPAVTAFTVASPSLALAIPIGTFTADADAAAFIITETSTPPDVGAAGWAASAPTTYTVAANGSYTLYPWVKDAAGNVSTVYASPASVVVTVYLFYDMFTTDDAAPITTPRNAEPGPGVWNATETAGAIAIASSQLEITGNNNVAQTILVSNASIARAAGLAMFLDRISGTANGEYGFNAAAAGTWDRAIDFRLNNSVDNWNGTAGQNLSIGAAMLPNNGTKYGVILRSAGAFMVYNDGTNWKLGFVYTNGTVTPLYPALTHYQNTKNTLDNVKVMQLGSPFTTDDAWATSSQASVNANATGTMVANGIVVATRTIATNDVFELSVRYTDDDNRWIVRADEAGNTVKLIQREGGTETERSSSAATLNNGTSYTFFALCSGNTITVGCYGGTSVANSAYASATFNNTATGTKVNLASTKFESYPITLPAACVAELSKWLP